jgi:hypothetical protein
MSSSQTYRDVSGLFSDEPFESKYYRQPNGVYRVQVHTDMPGVTPAMVRWWFADYMQTTEHYKRWHPKAHIWMDWENKRPGEVIGASHLVHEYLGKTLHKLRIQFIEPTELLGNIPDHTDRYIIAAKAGELKRPINLTTMCHIVNRTPIGSEMRSVFWMGHVSKRKGNENVKSVLNLLANTKLMRTTLIKDKMAQNLMTHCQEEMAILAGFIAGLYALETEASET